MNAFKLRRFHAFVILQCVRWYSRYTISYRQLEEMMAERGVVVDHTTGQRWGDTAAVSSFFGPHAPVGSPPMRGAGGGQG